MTFDLQITFSGLCAFAFHRDRRNPETVEVYFVDALDCHYPLLTWESRDTIGPHSPHEFCYGVRGERLGVLPFHGHRLKLEVEPESAVGRFDLSWLPEPPSSTADLKLLRQLARECPNVLDWIPALVDADILALRSEVMSQKVVDGKTASHIELPPGRLHSRGLSKVRPRGQGAPSAGQIRIWRFQRQENIGSTKLIRRWQPIAEYTEYVCPGLTCARLTSDKGINLTFEGRETSTVKISLNNSPQRCPIEQEDHVIEHFGMYDKVAAEHKTHMSQQVLIDAHDPQGKKYGFDSCDDPICPNAWLKVG